VKRALLALLIGGVFVGIVTLLSLHPIEGPSPFWFVLPGIIAAEYFIVGRFDPEEGGHPVSPQYVIVYLAVNIAIYGGIAYLLLLFGSSRPTRTSK
jgi:hypothetical protein